MKSVSTVDSDNNLVHSLCISAFKLLVHSIFYSKLLSINLHLYTLSMFYTVHVGCHVWKGHGDTTWSYGHKNIQSDV